MAWKISNITSYRWETFPERQRLPIQSWILGIPIPIKTGLSREQDTPLHQQLREAVNEFLILPCGLQPQESYRSIWNHSASTHWSLPGGVAKLGLVLETRSRLNRPIRFWICLLKWVVSGDSLKFIQLQQLHVMPSPREWLPRRRECICKSVIDTILLWWTGS